MLPTGLLGLFSYTPLPKTTCPGVTPPTVGWDITHQLLRKRSAGLPTGNLMEVFAQLRFLFLITRACDN